jgi:hypothetical protein
MQHVEQELVTLHEFALVFLHAIVGFVLYIFVKLHVFMFLDMCCWACIYVYLSPTRFPYQMMFVLFSRNMTGVTCGVRLLTLSEHLGSPPVFSGDRVTRSLVLCVVFWRLLFVPLSFFFWPLCCLALFDLLILNAPFVSSSSSLWVRLSTVVRYTLYVRYVS